MKIISSLFCLLISIQIYGQVRPIEELQNYINNTLPEKVYVHTDKDVYAAGENLWAAVYLVNGVSHAPGTLSEVVHIQIRNDENVSLYERRVYAPDGHAAADFRLGGDLPAGNYQLIAYTNYQLNTFDDFVFKKNFTIIDGLETVEQIQSKKKTKFAVKPRFQFFPEGGDCIYGVPCQVSVVSTDKVNATGVIKDETGKDIGKLTLNEGVGRFVYLPKAGGNYTMLIDGSTTIMDRKALDEGYHLSVKKQKDKLRITVSSNPESTVNGARVVLHVRGDAILDQQIEDNKSSGVLYLPFNELPAGVNTITVFNKRNEPMAERLYYVPLKANTAIKMDLEKDAFGRRKDVNLAFQAPLNEAFSDSINVSRISLSVLPQSLFTNNSSNDIRTYLTLNSDLEEHIDLDPSLLFSDDPRKTLRKIDDFLLTRAWRRFDWSGWLSEENYQPDLQLERGIYVQGYLTKKDSPKKRQPGKVFMTNMGAGFVEETVTDDEGNFVFGPYLAYDTSLVVVQGRSSKKKDNRRDEITLEDNPYLDIFIQDAGSPTFEKEVVYDIKPPAPKVDLDEYKAISDKFLSVAQSYDSLSIMLDMVDFKSTYKTKVQKEREERASLMGMKNPNSRLIIDSLGYRVEGQTIFDLIRNIPGFTVRGLPGEEEILARGNNSLTGSSSPLLVIDGIPTSYDLVRNYPAINIEFIDAIRGSRAAAKFGIDATNGAIIMYTRNGAGAVVTKKANPGLLDAQLRGFYKARVFATFDPNGVGNQNRPDIRTTIYWNPDIRTDIAGKAKDSFTTSDQDGKYIIIAEGLRSDGVPLSGSATFEVDSSLQ